MTSFERAPPLRHPAFLWILGVLICGTYLGVAACHVAFGSMSVDEGFYAAATRAVWQGEMPYRDFAFTHPRVVAYVNAPALQVTGFGLFQQRAVNDIRGFLSVLALPADLLPRGVYDEYGVPFLPPLATAVILILAPSFATWSRPKQALLASAVLLAPVAIIPAVKWRHLAPIQKHAPSWWLPVNTRPNNFNLPGNLQRARLTAERLLPPGDPFIGPNIILAIEAGRPIPRTMRMQYSKNSYSTGKLLSSVYTSTTVSTTFGPFRPSISRVTQTSIDGACWLPVTSRRLMQTLTS